MFETISERGVLAMEAKKLHDELTQKYYIKRSISKADFEAQHLTLWKDYENAVTRISPKISLTAEFALADTTDKKFAVILKRLG